MAEQTAIRKFTLTNFRNYGQLSLTLDRGLVVLTGDNGAGKTNLLEALSFLSPGRGLRRATLGDVARSGASQAGFAVHAELHGPYGECAIGTGTVGDAGDGTETGRRIRINGTPAKAAEELLDWVRVTWLTPAMDGLFTGPAAERRRFLDRMVLSIDPTHGRRAAAYERAMRSRNRLLSDNSGDGAWFDAIETQMAETGIAIAIAREELLRLIAAMIAHMPDDGPFPQALLRLEGGLADAEESLAAVDREENFRRALHDGRRLDRAAGRTLEGPHRTDLLVRHAPKDQPAELCSTGEQKALLVGLVLAHARLTGETSGRAPLLLLDEIAAHFDAGRRAALFDILRSMNCQHVMTGTERSLFDSLEGRAQFLSVSDGHVSGD